MLRPLTASLAAAVVTLTLAAAPALATTQRASSGPVTATFSFHRVDGGRYRDLRLTVQLSGQTVYDRPAATSGCAEPFCLPGGVSGPSVRVADLDGEGPPDAILDLFTGGAHCCSVSEIVALGDTGAGIRRVVHDWGDAGYRLEDLDGDGVDEFLSADDRFAYAFTAYAFSGLPVQIMSFAGEHFTDVTTSFPGRVRADARLWRRAYRHVHRFPQGVLAAWAADRYRLGHRHAALRFVRRQARHGKLRRELGAKRARHYVRRLDRTLRRWGY
jgi:hypothetical protein